MRLLLLAAALLVAPVARAQSEACSPYGHAAFIADMDEADRLLGEFDLSGARRKLGETQKKVPCLDEIAKPSSLARLGRQISLVFFFDQDEDSTRRWGLMSRYAWKDLPWSADFPVDHPFREQLEFAEEPPLGGPDDKGVAHPARGGVFLNGHFLTKPKAYAEVPGLVQVADKKGAILEAFWQDGARFPDSILGPSGVAAAPKWFRPEVPGPAVAVASIFEEPDPIDVPLLPDPEPVVVAPVPVPVVVAPVPEPVVVAPVPEPVVVAPVPEPVVAPVPEPVVVAPVPEPVVVKPVVEPVPKPDPVVVAPKPDPVVPKPDPVVVAPKPDPVVVPQPEPVVPKPDPVITDPRPPRGGSKVSVPRLAVGGGLALAAGALYGVGAASRGAFFNQAESGEELSALRTRTNVLAIAAGVTGAAALGVGVTAFISTDGARIGINGSF